ncbi:MAG: hypothetical protein CM15mP60_1900 [Alphaproteobacteria bacterium]|nr:MAG: hypothetical protein CM15mP60_1900 [Alphaproteobacteria bacterium]
MTRAETPIPLEISYPDTPKGMSDAEWHARVDLAAAYRLTHHYGWTSVVYNHIPAGARDRHIPDQSVRPDL